MPASERASKHTGAVLFAEPRTGGGASAGVAPIRQPLAAGRQSATLIIVVSGSQRKVTTRLGNARHLEQPRPEVLAGAQTRRRRAAVRPRDRQTGRQTGCSAGSAGRSTHTHTHGNWHP